MLKKIRNALQSVIALGPVHGATLILRERLVGIKSIDLSKTKYRIPYPIYLRPGTSDFKVFKQVFIEEEYGIKLEFKPSLIIDAGANIGLSSIYFKNRFSDATIICIEPDPDNVQALRKNLLPYSNIYIKQAGIWPHQAHTHITDKYGMGKWGMVIEESSEPDAIINTITISDLIKEFKLDTIDVLKLDIESAEKQLFTSDYMSWLPKVKVVIIELHDWMAEGCSKPFFTAINQAFSNFHFTQIGENTVIINRDLVPSRSR